MGAGARLDRHGQQGREANLARARTDGTGGTGAWAGTGARACGPVVELQAPEATWVPCGGDHTGTWSWESGCSTFALGCTGADPADRVGASPTWVVIAYSGTTTFDVPSAPTRSSTHVIPWRIEAGCRDASYSDATADEVCRRLTKPVVGGASSEPIGDHDCTTCGDGPCACVTSIDNPRPVRTPGAVR